MTDKQSSADAGPLNPDMLREAINHAGAGQQKLKASLAKDLMFNLNQTILGLICQQLAAKDPGFNVSLEKLLERWLLYQQDLAPKRARAFASEMSGVQGLSPELLNGIFAKYETFIHEAAKATVEAVRGIVKVNQPPARNS